MNEVFKEISQWRIGNVANFTLPRPIKVPVTQPLDVGRSLEMVQIEVHRWKKYFTFWLRKKINKNFLPNSDMLYFIQKGDSQSVFTKFLIMKI